MGTFLYGAAGGNRTHDPLLTKEVRYHYATAAQCGSFILLNSKSQVIYISPLNFYFLGKLNYLKTRTRIIPPKSRFCSRQENPVFIMI